MRSRAALAKSCAPTRRHGRANVAGFREVRYRERSVRSKSPHYRFSAHNGAHSSMCDPLKKNVTEK